MEPTTDEAEASEDTALAVSHGLVAPESDRVDSTRLGPLKISHTEGPYFDVDHLDGPVAVQLDTINVRAFPSAGALASYLWWMLERIESRDGEALPVSPEAQVGFWGPEG